MKRVERRRDSELVRGDLIRRCDSRIGCWWSQRVKRGEKRDFLLIYSFLISHEVAGALLGMRRKRCWE